MSPEVIAPRANGALLDLSEDAFGELRRSEDLVDHPEGVLDRLAEDGYVYLPGFWPSAEVTPVRAEVARLLAEGGFTDPDAPMRITCRKPVDLDTKREIVEGNEVVRKFLRQGRTTAYLERVWDGPVRALDFIGMRMISPGIGTYPHADIVYFSRGTPRLLTGWTPLGDVPIELGGLLLLEGSHRHQRLQQTYLRRDVDSYCVNRRDADKYASNEKRWTGALATDFLRLRNAIGGRWLTTNYRQGDLVLFVMNMVHGSLDNQTDRIRLSADPRYQPMHEPADHRYIGENPVRNTAAAKRGRIC
ncbi:phytanoyl-CoA dioxygenase family protein [Lentzea sp. BCCO 10_0061]|uniref:Phytanoyl-CoA dioxygenase family protein n=1 Tax=Lentzea sokolovensis TaxID=3095429 RepID=A0ABU4V7A4_9PSEU|nr:phytanoyl-CoA dioxygenase family protein [Lentzea sp. BCCO 10_0061]MDX8147109.1 phytanoyl-CoA dioxygenase family protein [Lentzea sp. BCCO 10_0061]